MTAPSAWRQHLRAYWPAPMVIDTRERVRVSLGAGLGLLLTGLLSLWLGRPAAIEGLGLAPLTPWLVAPLGASAVLVFGVPASPLAQPWSVIGGNTLSALIGVLCVHWVPWPVLAAPLAAGLAVALMLKLRCLHPPGGASALFTVLAGVTDWRFALFPILLNSLLLVAAGVAYNSLTGRRYPHVAVPPAAPTTPATPAMPWAEATPRFTDADLDVALKQYNQLLDLPRDDLRDLLETAEAQAHQRRLSRLHCSDIMTPDPAAVQFGTSLHEAWTLLHQRQVKALPVVDRYQHIVGIVTLADFMRAAGFDGLAQGDQKLRRLLRTTDGDHADKPEVVGQIMTRQVRVAAAHRSLAELLPLLSASGHHHIPVVGDQGRLLGMVTQSDVITALMRDA
jgi:CBS domain-containing membrane protein